MENVSINAAYTIYEKLPIEDKEYFLQLIEKQIIEARREAIVMRAKEAEFNYNNGNVYSSNNVDKLMECLEHD